MLPPREEQARQELSFDDLVKEMKAEDSGDAPPPEPPVAKPYPVSFDDLLAELKAEDSAATADASHESAASAPPLQ